MRELTADPFISLDGFASGVKEAAFFGYFGEGLGNWVSDHLHQPQLLIMGRLTYDALAQFSPSGTDDVNVRMTELPKLVFSSTLKEPLTWKNTRLAKASIADEITALKQSLEIHFDRFGSISLVRSMMQQDSEKANRSRARATTVSLTFFTTEIPVLK